MKLKNIILMTSVATLLVSCDEFAPVFTGEYGQPEENVAYDDGYFEEMTRIDILDLKNLYVEGQGPVKLAGEVKIGEENVSWENVYVKGQITTSDRAGNFYRGFYIQDASAGLEVKLGKSGLYNEYKLGQWVYVKCGGLVLGDYEGAKQIGAEDITGEYETAYMDVQYLIDKHVFKGAYDTPVQPEVVDVADLKKPEYLGKYVTINNLVYQKKIFCLAYINPNLNKKDNDNRIFLDEDDPNAWGVTTWAISKNKFSEYLASGVWDKVTIGNWDSNVKLADRKFEVIPNAYSVSQFFKVGSVSVEIRTSGYCKFADMEMGHTDENGNFIPLAKNDKINVTGILGIYDGDSQITIIDETGVEYL